MAQKFAKDQPSGFTNRINKVAIAGAGGRLGKHFAEELLKTGKHTVTALSRADSKSTFPEGVTVVGVNYDETDSLVSALKGQQFLVIALSVRSPPETHNMLVQAAATAGIPYVMPNAYGYDIRNKKFVEEDLYTADSMKRIAEVEDLGGSSYVAMVCGAWYEWGLASGGFGIDVRTLKATLFDDGNTRVNLSSWRQCGRGLAALLILKELPQDASDTAPTVSQWKNKPLYVSSFAVSQRDILDSIHRSSGTTDEDWEIEYEPTAERYKNGLDEMKKGDRMGFAKAMYARIFFPNGDGDFGSSRGLDNPLIGLQNEELDEVTMATLEKIKGGWNPFAS